MAERGLLGDLIHLLQSTAEKRSLKSWHVEQNTSGELEIRICFASDIAIKSDNPDVVGSEKKQILRTSSPSDLTCVGDYEDYCHNHMDPKTWTYFSDASMMQMTRKRNVDAFSKILISPKHFVDVSNPWPVMERSISLTGEIVSFPVGISPTAHHRWITPEGEISTIRAARKVGVVYISSIHSNTKLEDIAEAEPTAMFWQQTYIFKKQSLNKQILHKAETAGVKAIVLTIDKTVGGCFWGREEVPYPTSLGFANLGSLSEVCTFNAGATWEDAQWFCQQTSLPVVLKGVLTREDAEMAVKIGAKAVIVSNHGGRALDSLPATMEVLQNIVNAVDGQLEVFMDGGIRSGMDVFKALAFGAKMVFIGRPAIWGLAHSGQAGLENILNILKRELANVMKLAGTPTLDDINKDRIYFKGELPRW